MPFVSNLTLLKKKMKIIMDEICTSILSRTDTLTNSNTGHNVKKRVIHRPDTVGVTVGHLRRLGRKGGKIILGEIVNGESKCKVCGLDDDDDNMLLCDECNDGYHLWCLKPILVALPADDWFCCECKEDIKQKFNQFRLNFKENQTTLHQFFKVVNSGHGSNNNNSIIETNESELLERSSSSSSSSSSRIVITNNNIKKKNSSRSSTEISLTKNEAQDIISFNNTPKKKKKKRKAVVFSSNKKRKYNTFVIAKSSLKERDRIHQLISMASAVKAKDMIYSNDLYYPASCGVYRNMNNALLDKLNPIQTMSQSNLRAFREYKRLCGVGYYPPLEIQNDEQEGFVVIAKERLPRNSFITEYCGTVEILESAKDDDNDSIMDLMICSEDSKSLVIVPRSHGNIARFISGINNHDKKLAKKQNVYSARFSIDNECRVILFAARDINVGEQLYYDYNGGIGDKNYPTENFV